MAYPLLAPIAKAHREQDALISGVYAKAHGDQFKGCSVGCVAHDAFPDMSALDIQEHDNIHKAVSDHFGYPEWLARLQDHMFES